MLHTLLLTFLSLPFLPAGGDATTDTLGEAASTRTAVSRDAPRVLVNETLEQEPETVCTLTFTCEAHGPMGTFSGDCSGETRLKMAQIALDICADEVE